MHGLPCQIADLANVLYCHECGSRKAL